MYISAETSSVSVELLVFIFNFFESARCLANSALQLVVDAIPSR